MKILMLSLLNALLFLHVTSFGMLIKKPHCIQRRRLTQKDNAFLSDTLKTEKPHIAHTLIRTQYGQKTFSIFNSPNISSANKLLVLYVMLPQGPREETAKMLACLSTLSKYSTPCIDDDMFDSEEIQKLGEAFDAHPLPDVLLKAHNIQKLENKNIGFFSLPRSQYNFFEMSRFLTRDLQKLPKETVDAYNTRFIKLNTKIRTALLTLPEEQYKTFIKYETRTSSIHYATTTPIFMEKSLIQGHLLISEKEYNLLATLPAILKQESLGGKLVRLKTKIEQQNDSDVVLWRCSKIAVMVGSGLFATHLLLKNKVMQSLISLLVAQTLSAGIIPATLASTVYKNDHLTYDSLAELKPIPSNK